MSHPMYNPRGAPFSNQRPVMSNQYGVNAQPVLDMAVGRLGPAAGLMSPMMPQQMGYQMAQHPTGLPQDMESTIDMHIRGAREEVRLLNQMMHQPPKDPRLRKESREEMLSQGNSFPPQRAPGRPEEQSTVDWSNYPKPNKHFASQVMAQPSTPAQMFQPSGFGNPSGGGRESADRQPPPASIPSERRQSCYTSESASSILASFGLSSEDLELLSHYPDEQLTPDNLPFILRDIRVRKAKRNMLDVDHRLPSPATQERLAGEPQTSKVIDYGHSSKYGYSEKSQDSFKQEHRTTNPLKYMREAPVAASTFPSVDTKRQSSAPVAKKPPADQRKNPPDMEDKAGKSVPPRDSLPAPHRPTAGPLPPAHGIRANEVNVAEGSGAQKPGFAVKKPAWSPSFPPSNAGNSKRLPTPTMMNDYSAASPRIFPHTCSLCNVECVQIKDWIEHQNTSVHIESCRRLRKQFPEWNVETVSVSRNEKKPPPDHRPSKRRSRSPSRSRSRSRSPSSSRYYGRSDSRGHRPRSRSPRRYGRSRSRSRSPRRRAYPQVLPPPRRRSRTPPPRRSRTPPPRRSRTPPPRRSRTPPRWWSPHWRPHSPPPRRSRTPPSRRSRTPPSRRSRSRSFTRLSPPRAAQRVNPRHASPRRQQRSSSSEKLAKKLIESSGLAVTQDTTLEAMVESLAPALMAELAKKKGGTSSASTKSAGKKQTSPPAPGKTVPSKISVVKNVKGKKGSPCYLRLKGVPFNTSHQELMSAVQAYGKVISATLFKKIEEAKVCMENEEDAKALAECRNLKISGRTIRVSLAKDASDHKAKTLVGKKKEVPSAKLPAGVKAKVPAKKTDGNSVKKVAKKDILKKCVKILGLPENFFTEDDLKNLAKPFGFSSGLVIDVLRKLALVELPDLNSAEAMLKTYKESPPKIEDCPLTFELMTRPVNFSNPESLFTTLMGIEKSTETANLGDRLLVVNNVPMGISPTTEVKELIKRFGSFKEALVLNRRMIFEMDTPVIAKAIFNRFQKFPSCIVQNNPLTFSVIKSVKATEAVKKKPEVKSGEPAPKPGDGAKKGSSAPKALAAGSKGAPTVSKTTAPAGKAKMPKTPATTSTPTVMKDDKPAAASTAATAKTAQPHSTKPPASTVVATAAQEPPEGAVTSAESQKLETTDDPKSRLDAPTGVEGTDKVPHVEVKDDQGASQEALLSNIAPKPEEGDVGNSAAVEDKDVTVAAVDSKQDGEPSEAAKPESEAQPGEALPTDDGPDEKPPDFPPVTQEILRALEAAVHECRMRSVLRRSEEAKRDEAAKDEEPPPVTHRGDSSGSSSSSRKSRNDGSPSCRKGNDHEGGVDNHKKGDLSSRRSSKSLCEAKDAGDGKAEEKDNEDEVFPFDLDEFVTVDEVGDGVEGSPQEEEKKTSEPLPSSSPVSDCSRVRRSTRNSTTAKSQNKPAPSNQKSLKKPATPAKGKQTKVIPKPVVTKDVQEPQAAADGPGEVAAEMESETPKVEVEVDAKMEKQKVEEDKAKPPDASDTQGAEDVEASASESLPLKAAADANTTTETVTLAVESQPEEEAESIREAAAPSVPSDQITQEPPVERSPSEQCPAEAAPSGTVSPETKTDQVQTKQEQPKKKPEPSIKKARQGLAAALVTLDEVSEEEEDYPDEEEEEKLLMQQNEALVTVDEVGADEDPFLPAVKDLQALVTLDEFVEKDEPRSEPFPLGQGEETGDAFNPEALLTLDETQGDDENGEEGVKLPNSGKSTGSPATHEAMVTLDESQGDDEETGEEGVKLPNSGKSTGSPATHEAMVTLDETGDDEETGEEGDKKPDSEKSTGSPATHEAVDETPGDNEVMKEVGDKITSSEKSTESPSLPTGLTPSGSPVEPSAESGDLVKSPGSEDKGTGLEELQKMNFVTVDEVGEEEEQEQQQEGEEEAEPAPSPAVRGGRPKKKGRQATVRKSTRGRKPLPVKEEAEPSPVAPVKEDDPSPVAPVEPCSVEDPSDARSQDLVSLPETQTVKEPSENVPDSKPNPGGAAKSNGNKDPSADPAESLCTTKPTATIKEESKLRREVGGKEEPDAKRERTESPTPTPYKMPPFSANNPIGLEFVVPKAGFFCKLCSLFYGNEDAAKKTHCSSLKHYQNMEKHFMKL